MGQEESVADAGEPIWGPAIAGAIYVPAALLVLYYGAALLSLHREAITLEMDWERHIPLVPSMIIPYLCLDPMIVATMFVCRTRKELRRLIAAILTAAVVAGTCFVAMPTRAYSNRPDSDSLMYPIFDALDNFDVKTNAAPSLHAALALILWAPWARRLRGPIAWAAHVGFGMIIVSTVLTHRHHVADVVAGILLAWVCIRTWMRDSDESDEVLPAAALAKEEQKRPGTEEP